MNLMLLKVGRHFAGLTQAELALQIGVNQSVLSKYESGSIHMNSEVTRKIKAVFAENGIGSVELVFLEDILKTK